MSENIKIGIIGGDKRQLICADGLSCDFECAVWGFASVYGNDDEKYLKNTVRCADWMSAVKCSDAVILPLPASTDGVRLNCPLAVSGGDAPDIRLLEICEKMKPGSLLVGGMIPAVIKRYAVERGLSVTDYYDSEELQIKNSVPTAEGAIGACIDKLPMTVSGMKTAVFGYGRVGRVLAGRLRALGATVYAAARNPRDRAYAYCDGCIPVTIDEFKLSPCVCDAIFNTVPYQIFDRDFLSKLSEVSPKAVIFELASACSGVDMKAAAEIPMTVVPLLSLPGKTAWKSAGDIICSVVKKTIYERIAEEKK